MTHIELLFVAGAKRTHKFKTVIKVGKSRDNWKAVAIDLVPDNRHVNVEERGGLMHHSRMTQWETWSHTIYTQGPSLLSISNYFPTGLTHQSETFLWVYFPDDFSEAAWCGFFFRPSAFHLVGDEKGQCASKVKVCWWRLPPFEALSLGNRCVPCPASQTLPDWINSMCVLK